MGTDFIALKSGHRLEKQPVLGLAHGFSTSFLGPTRNLIWSRKYVMCRFNSTPIPLSKTSLKFLWEFFASHLVSTTCKLTPFEMQLESALNSLKNMFWKYACSKFYIEENTRAKVQFIELTLRQRCSSVSLPHIFRTPFPKNTSGRAASAIFPHCRINPLFCMSPS